MPFLDTIDKTIIWEDDDYERAYVYGLDPDVRLTVTCIRGVLVVYNHGAGIWPQLTEGQSMEIYPVSDWLDLDGSLQLFKHGEYAGTTEALLSYGSSSSTIGVIAAVSSQLDQTGKERIHISSDAAYTRSGMG